MNKSFLIIFIPALLVAAGYLALGIRPPTRVEIGIAVFAVAFSVYRIRVMIQRGKPAEPKASSAPPAANP
ncbi:MAG TPA: hypothetical protein VJW51_05205 [Candidatus Acidoferrales bacterium]|nr:hypothetical protein [Candidatus Acidoferrales bacterium]